VVPVGSFRISTYSANEEARFASLTLARFAFVGYY
jgi:hypothetical protein